MAVFRAFYRSFGRMLFVSVLCFAFGFMSAWAEEYTITYLNQYGDEISDLTPDRYKEEELPLARENLPNSEAVSIATGCELVDELWYWDDKMSEPVESIEPEPLEDKVLYGNLSCDENRIVTLNPAGKEEIGSKGTEQLYYYRNLGDYGEFFYNEYNGSKSAAGLASTIILPTYDTEKYTFLGYYADPDDMETQCVDERGYITKYGFQQMAEGGEGETSWDAVYDTKSVPVTTIELRPMYGSGTTSAGTGYIYAAPVFYGGGIYAAYGDVYQSGQTISSITVPTWSGHTFLGYYPSSASTSPQYIDSSGSITASGVTKAEENGNNNQVWYGRWSQISLTYNCGSHGLGGASYNVTTGNVSLESSSGLCEPSYEYCVFTGWDCGDGVLLAPGQQIEVVDDTTCTAQWECLYNVTFAPGDSNNNGTGTSATGSTAAISNQSAGTSITLPASTFTAPSGYTFNGWYCNQGIGNKAVGFTFTMPSANVICTAQWASLYTLVYDCGVHGTAPAGVTQNSGSNVQLANGCNGILSSDYDFQGWYCVPQTSGWGNVYNGGDSYPLYNNTICTAIWTESNPCAPGSEASNSPEILGGAINSWNQISSVNVSFSDLSGMCSETVGSYPGQIGTPSSTSGDYCWCQATSYNSTPLNNYPWVFVQYYDGCNVADCQKWCLSSINQEDPDYFFNVSLLSKPICEYTLTYDCANGNNAQSALFGGTYQGGQSMGLWANGGDCTAPTNQTFDYWTCDNGTVNNNMVNPTPYDNMTCTAHWKNLPTYSLTYNCNNNNAGGSAPTDSNSPYYAGTTDISLAGDEGSCNPPSNDMGFSGWSCHKGNDSSVPYSEGDAMPAYNVVCDAQWEQLYNVIYNCNNSSFGGTAPATQSYHVGNTVSILSTMPQNTCVAPNMMFDHWDCHKEDDNTVSFNSGSAMQAYNVVCDAQWVHRVQYMCGSGTQITPNVYVTTSDASVILADIGSFCTVPSGYVFYKWSCVSNRGYMYGDFYDSGYNYVFTSPTVDCIALYREISCNSGETTVPFVLGQEMTLTDWENNSSVWGEYSNITLGNLWNPTSASYSGNSATFSNSSSNWMVNINGKCSDTSGMVGETGHPNDTFGNECWCQVGSIVVNNGSGVPLSGYPWVYAGTDATQSSCTTNSCSNICAINAANGYNYSTDMANFFLQSLYTQNTCVSVPTTYTVTYHGGSCNASASTFNETVDAGTSYTVENPECASSNSNDWLPTDGCSNFIGWSDSPYDSTQTASSQVVYGTCDACATQTGSCGTISNISSNIDLYAICDVMAHNVIYHNCDGDEVYTHSNAISLSDGAQSVDYTPLSPSGPQLSSLITPLSSFQGWATSETAGDDESWCGLEPGDLYQELYGGNSDNDYYTYTKTGEICTDVDLYAVCCPLNLNWDVNGGSWPTGSSGNQTTCEYGAIAGSAGSIGYGQTPLQTPLRTGYTFTGWKVTNYSTP